MTHNTVEQKAPDLLEGFFSAAHRLEDAALDVIKYTGHDWESGARAELVAALGEFAAADQAIKASVGRTRETDAEREARRPELDEDDGDTPAMKLEREAADSMVGRKVKYRRDVKDHGSYKPPGRVVRHREGKPSLRVIDGSEAGS